MRTFLCQKCGQPLFFENVQCLSCSSRLAFLPDRMNLAPIEEVEGEEGVYRPYAKKPRKAPRRYRLCQTRLDHGTCNFAVPADDPNPLCASCRLTRVLPNLSTPENLQRWTRIEIAKRRLFYTLVRLGLLSPDPRIEEPERLVFEFLEDQPGRQVMTGHADGLITINVAEADDDERVARRVALHEPYRTLLGHFRHEIGHYYWDVLIRDGGRLEACRAIFGDESVDYQQALQAHYESGGQPEGWQDSFVSAYATSHPWEDWAETWTHYLHMVDLLETAAGYNTRITLPGEGEEELEEVTNPFETRSPDFDELVQQWVPITLLVNSLNRSLGQEDAYPFALSPGALKKLRFVHDVIQQSRRARIGEGKSQQVMDPAPAEAQPAATGA
ncbi:zinc-binding metallopeptidase family protein [Ramlibacter pallidus]|uniref:Zinc-binding metallopeptidase n=1 Tax=Ramlibacter pallidus TaxID=2780087 RepID=A0ABR9RZ11_9BURK|nr:putative zinc-binding metallopeptidase [Ramlibacter pallidus]MBE7366492.1 putative zinc-binding metallopeptidase [Ramlibacter pallidus]